MPLNIPEQVVSLLTNGVHRTATCYTITRLDGTIIRLTDHDNTLVVEGQTYVPTETLIASARQKLDSLRVHNIEATGLNSSLITDEDLRARKFDHATVDEFTVDWRYPFYPYDRRTYTIGEITVTSETWVAQLLGLVSRLRQRRGYLYTRTCRWALGDAFCGVSLASLTVSAATVSSVSAARRTIVTSLSGGGFADNYFAGGLVTWHASNSNNPGVQSEVKSSTAAGQLELQLRTPFDILVGDEFSIYPGCNKTPEQCKTKFNNWINYGGFPAIPGNDRAHNTPDANA